MEISLYRDALPEASSAALASMLLGKHTSPTQAAVRAERMLRIQEALNTLDPIDREVLALRHFEQLSRSETAEVLGIAIVGCQTLLSCSQTAEGRARRHARRSRGSVNHGDVHFERVSRVRAL